MIQNKTKLESELNRENAQELSRLILENPKMRVMAQINSEGIYDDYGWYAGSIGKPRISIIAYSETREQYVEKEGDMYEDCYNYYGCCADDWTDEELAEKAAQIPWEDVITVYVSTV